MPRLTDLLIILGCSLAAAAEIIGQAWADDLSINGTSLQSTNHGSITASGAFDAGGSISGGAKKSYRRDRSRREHLARTAEREELAGRHPRHQINYRECK